VIETAVAGAVPRFELPEWRERYGIVAGITGRGTETSPFDFGLAGTTTTVGAVMGHWRRLRQALPEFAAVVVSRQVHGTELLWHGAAGGLVLHDRADGHGTATEGVLLAVTVADCIPVYLIDPVRRAVALLHAGWRGVAGGILGKGLDLLTGQGSDVENVSIHCGIGICGRCYEVGAEVLSACGLSARLGEKRGLDLRAVLTAQARSYSVQKVSTSSLCSAHSENRFFSHRASGGADGRMVAYLGLPATT
jgi:hypothetical protein